MLRSMGSQRVRQDLTTEQLQVIKRQSIIVASLFLYTIEQRYKKILINQIRNNYIPYQGIKKRYIFEAPREFLLSLVSF